MSKREMIESLLEAYEHAITAGPPEECASQFVIWQSRVALGLASAGMDAEHKAWREAEEMTRFYDDDATFTAQAESMKAILVGILEKLEEIEPSAELFPMEIVEGTRNYIEKLATQANGCYQKGWYDACAVMVRRLIEILIIDSFDAKGKLSDIREARHLSLSSNVSERPTASEIRRFLEEDFPQLETALKDVQASLGGSPLANWSATSNWQSVIIPRLTDLPDDIQATFEMVVTTRDCAWGGIAKLTGEQLRSAKRGISHILEFLHQEFPSAGIDLPDQGEIVSLGRLIEKYLAVADSYWHIERAARPALRKIKAIGDVGAHGRYVKVTKQTLDKYQDALIAGIQQLVGTAYGK